MFYIFICFINSILIQLYTYNKNTLQLFLCFENSFLPSCLLLVYDRFYCIFLYLLLKHPPSPHCPFLACLCSAPQAFTTLIYFIFWLTDPNGLTVLFRVKYKLFIFHILNRNCIKKIWLSPHLSWMILTHCRSTLQPSYWHMVNPRPWSSRTTEFTSTLSLERWCHSPWASRTFLWSPGKGGVMTLVTLMVRPASWTLTAPLAHQTSGSRGTKLPGLTPRICSLRCRICRFRCQQWGTLAAPLSGMLPLPWALRLCLLRTPWWRHRRGRTLWAPWAAQVKRAATFLLTPDKSAQCPQDALLGCLRSQAPRYWLLPHVLKPTVLVSSLLTCQLPRRKVTLVRDFPHSCPFTHLLCLV